MNAISRLTTVAIAFFAETTNEFHQAFLQLPHSRPTLKKRDRARIPLKMPVPGFFFPFGTLGAPTVNTVTLVEPPFQSVSIDTDGIGQLTP